MRWFIENQERQHRHNIEQQRDQANFLMYYAQNYTLNDNVNVIPTNIQGHYHKVPNIYTIPLADGADTTSFVKLFEGLKQKYPDSHIMVHDYLNMRTKSRGHLCYYQALLSNNSLSVKIFDPCVRVSANLYHKLLGHKDPKTFMVQYFQQVAETLQVKEFSFEYNYCGHQIMNFHDCGRFSTIYLLNAVFNSKLPQQLSGLDILKGFQYIEKNGFEGFQDKYQPLLSKITGAIFHRPVERLVNFIVGTEPVTKIKSA